ncbi:MAG: TOBE domain-containing protein [Sulfurimonas sp.]
MNQIKASVTEIQSVDNLNIVTFKANNHMLKMMSLDLSGELVVDTNVSLSFKPTTVAIAKNISGDLSFSNQLQVKIISMEVGQLLSSLKLGFDEYTLESIITTASVKRMNLKVGESVIALIKSSDLSIGSVLL